MICQIPILYKKSFCNQCRTDSYQYTLYSDLIFLYVFIQNISCKSSVINHDTGYEIYNENGV